MTREWAITLPGPFRRRVEDGSLVLWRPGLTVFVTVWGNDHHESARDRLDGFKARASKERFGEREEVEGEIVRWSYRLDEHEKDGRVPALYGFVVGRTGHVQLSVYFDREEDEKVARALWSSIGELP